MTVAPDDPGLAPIAERLASHPRFAGRAIVLRPLAGGLTNRNLLVELDGGTERHALRIPGVGTPLLGIVRPIERDAAVAAAEAGVAPAVTGWVTPEGWLVTELLAATPVLPERLAGPDGRRAIGELLRRVHGARAVPALFQPLRIVELHGILAADRGHPAPDAPVIAALLGRLERALAPTAPPLRLCHNDLLAGNILDDGARLRLIDWEYAGMGDPYFDLGNLAANHHLDGDAIADVVRAWLGAAPASHELARVRLHRIVSDLREGMWAVLQEVASTLPVDYAAYAAEHLGRAIAMAAARATEGDLALVAGGPVPRVPPRMTAGSGA